MNRLTCGEALQHDAMAPGSWDRQALESFPSPSFQNYPSLLLPNAVVVRGDADGVSAIASAAATDGVFVPIYAGDVKKRWRRRMQF